MATGTNTDGTGDHEQEERTAVPGNDPTDTDHPVGEEQAAELIENDPPG